MAVTTDLKDEVLRRITESGDAVRERVVTHLVEEEVALRTKLLVSALAKRDDLMGKLSKIKPSPLSFDAEGKPLLLGFTVQQNGERKKFQDQLKSVESAIDKAFASPADWETLKRIGETKTDDKGVASEQ